VDASELAVMDASNSGGADCPQTVPAAAKQPRRKHSFAKEFMLLLLLLLLLLMLLLLLLLLCLWLCFCCC
jgi:hypothetical protein